MDICFFNHNRHKEDTKLHIVKMILHVLCVLVAKPQNHADDLNYCVLNYAGCKKQGRNCPFLQVKMFPSIRIRNFKIIQDCLETVLCRQTGVG